VNTGPRVVGGPIGGECGGFASRPSLGLSAPTSVIFREALKADVISLVSFLDFWLYYIALWLAILCDYRRRPSQRTDVKSSHAGRIRRTNDKSRVLREEGYMQHRKKEFISHRRKLQWGRNMAPV
jgi:hypothetical protein